MKNILNFEKLLFGNIDEYIKEDSRDISRLKNNDPIAESTLNEISNEVLSKYKKAAGKDALKADKEKDYARGDKRFKGIIKATVKQFDNDDKNKEKTNEAKFEYDKKSGGMKMNDSDPDQRHGLYLDGKLSKTYNSKEAAENVKKRDPKYKDAVIKKISEGMMGGLNRVSNPGLKYDKVLDEVKNRWKQEQMEAIDPWHGYTSDDPKAGALAKAPKNAVQGTTEFPLSDMIKDNIKAHGLKWAFQYHVLKHGLPPRQFQILAGLTPKKISTEPLGKRPIDIELDE